MAYTYVQLALNFFSWTRPVASEILDYVPAPVVGIAKAVAACVPDLFFIVILMIIAKYLLKIMRFSDIQHYRRGSFDLQEGLQSGERVKIIVTERQPTVFIVDDDPSFRDSLQFLLGAAGLGVRSFPSARDFLDGADPETPGCLLLDVRMPGMSGLDLQNELANAGISLPIIFITGHGTVPMSVRAMKAGAVDFLQKPFDEQDLLDAIHQAVEQDRQARMERDELREIQKRINSLTAREYQVFTLLVSGMLNKQVAYRLGTTERTIKAHRSRIMEKTKAESLTDLVRHAEKLGVGKPRD